MRVAPRVGPAWAYRITQRGPVVRATDCDHRFRGAYRLRKAHEYSKVFAFRRSLTSTHFQLQFAPTAMTTGRLGLVIARRHAPSAVLRCLIKRLAREAFRMARLELPAFDLVLRLRARPAQVDRKALRAELDRLLARLPG